LFDNDANLLLAACHEQSCTPAFEHQVLDHHRFHDGWLWSFHGEDFLSEWAVSPPETLTGLIQ
jgi:hypothetical protein